MVIYKYPLEEMVGEIELPHGAKVLTANLDCDNEICIWAAIPDKNAKKEKRKFVVLGTGWKLMWDEKYTYINTIIDKEAGLVWHVIELLN